MTAPSYENAPPSSNARAKEAAISVAVALRVNSGNAATDVDGRATFHPEPAPCWRRMRISKSSPVPVAGLDIGPAAHGGTLCDGAFVEFAVAPSHPIMSNAVIVVTVTVRPTRRERTRRMLLPAAIFRPDPFGLYCDRDGPFY
jgi:hypothetical protein